jgi:hypothetical protein
MWMHVNISGAATRQKVAPLYSTVLATAQQRAFIANLNRNNLKLPDTIVPWKRIGITYVVEAKIVDHSDEDVLRRRPSRHGCHSDDSQSGFEEGEGDHPN